MKKKLSRFYKQMLYSTSVTDDQYNNSYLAELDASFSPSCQQQAWTQSRRGFVGLLGDSALQ